MKRTLSVAFALALAGGAVSAATAGEVIERQTTEKTTTYRGTVSELDPSSSSFMIRSDTAAVPQKYVYTEKTTFVDEAGNTVTYEAIKNRPVTVTYVREGDRMVVSKVVVSNPTGGVIKRKETTTEEIPAD